MKKKAKPAADTFANALAMLAGVAPSPCPTCMGRGWYLGYHGRAVCHGCRGAGTR